MNLKPQTVYIPIVEESWLHINENYFEKKENQICLSKEELVELVRYVFEHGKQRGSAEEVEGIYINKIDNIPDTEELINNLFNQ